MLSGDLIEMTDFIDPNHLVFPIYSIFLSSP